LVDGDVVELGEVVFLGVPVDAEVVVAAAGGAVEEVVGAGAEAGVVGVAGAPGDVAGGWVSVSGSPGFSGSGSVGSGSGKSGEGSGSGSGGASWGALLTNVDGLSIVNCGLALPESPNTV
jgi:hypothetical protein